jgi:hypothetical protein
VEVEGNFFDSLNFVSRVAENVAGSRTHDLETLVLLVLWRPGFLKHMGTLLALFFFKQLLHGSAAIFSVTYLE